AVRPGTAQVLRWTRTRTLRAETSFVSDLPLRKTTICRTVAAAGAAVAAASAAAASSTTAALRDRRDRIDLHRSAANRLESQPVRSGRPPARREQDAPEA